MNERTKLKVEWLPQGLSTAPQHSIGDFVHTIGAITTSSETSLRASKTCTSTMIGRKMTHEKGMKMATG